MLPSRSRLQSWRPDALAAAGSAVTHAGATIYQAVLDLDNRIDAMPESRHWEGQAQLAAADMFKRATSTSSELKNYTEAVGTALRRGSEWIGHARSELLSKAEAIDAGELNVTDQWVVLLDPAEMSAEKSAQLQKQADAAQADINDLLLAVGAADDRTTQQLLLARAKGSAFDSRVPHTAGALPPRPADDVLDPSEEAGRQFQEMARAQDLATTVREKSETTDTYGNFITTYTMLDGSTHKVTEWIDQGLPSQQIYPAGTLQVLHKDKNGAFVSSTMTTPREDGGSKTEVRYAGGTEIVISQNPDGTRSGSCTTPGKDYAILPDSFFQDPLPTMAGGALSGLEAQAGRGITGLSVDALEGLKAGAKWGGPAMGIAQTAFQLATADSIYEKCVAAWSGGIGVAGGVITSAVAGSFGGPLGVMGGNVAGGFVFGYVGKLVGNVLCAP